MSMVAFFAHATGSARSADSDGSGSPSTHGMRAYGERWLADEDVVQPPEPAPLAVAYGVRARTPGNARFTGR